MSRQASLINCSRGRIFGYVSRIHSSANKARKKIDVSFDDSKTNLDAIHKAIANSGYDTDKVAGNEEAYKDLPGCCQYDHTMEMSLAEALNDDTDKDGQSKTDDSQDK